MNRALPTSVEYYLWLSVFFDRHLVKFRFPQWPCFEIFHLPKKIKLSMHYQDHKNTVERERLTCTKHSHLHLMQTFLKLERSCPWNCLLPFLCTQRSSPDYILNSPFISLIYTYESKGEFEIRSWVTNNIAPHKLCYVYQPTTGKNNNNKAY